MIYSKAAIIAAHATAREQANAMAESHAGDFGVDIEGRAIDEVAAALCLDPETVREAISETEREA